MKTVAVCLFGLLMIVGCSGAGEGTRPPETGSSNIITQEEIRQTGAPTAYDVVRLKRPLFLRSRGAKSIRSPHSSMFPVVYLDGMRYGDVESLKTIQAGVVEEIRFIDAADATIQYGTDHASGIIAVKTKRGG